MMYREVSKEEAKIGDTVVTRNGSRMVANRILEAGAGVDFAIVLRPIRDVDDLTDEELVKLYDHGDRCGDKRGKVRDILQQADKLRSRPKETEKERWIREYMESIPFDSDTKLKSLLSDAWDAAYEAGRKTK